MKNIVSEKSWINSVHLRAMLRKNWLQMNSKGNATMWELAFTLLYGYGLGSQASYTLNNPAWLGMGYMIFLTITPVAF